MPTNRKEHLRFRYGICLNDGCSKCKSKEVQQIAARKDFICEECKKPLRECPPPKSSWNKYGKIIIGASVAVIAGAAIWFFGFRSTESETYVESQIVGAISKSGNPVGEPGNIADKFGDSADKSDDSVDEPGNIADKLDAPADKSDDNPKRPVPAPSIRVPFGTYSGPANGLDGEIKVTRSYTLDLRNATHDKIELLPGDKITHTKFKNGELVQGYWHRGSESRSFHR